MSKGEAMARKALKSHCLPSWGVCWEQRGHHITEKASHFLPKVFETPVSFLAFSFTKI